MQMGTFLSAARYKHVCLVFRPGVSARNLLGNKFPRHNVQTHTEVTHKTALPLRIDPRKSLISSWHANYPGNPCNTAAEDALDCETLNDLNTKCRSTGVNHLTLGRARQGRTSLHLIMASSWCRLPRHHVIATPCLPPEISRRQRSRSVSSGASLESQTSPTAVSKAWQDHGVSLATNDLAPARLIPRSGPVHIWGGVSAPGLHMR